MMTVALATSACGGGPRWPTTPSAVVDPSFAGAERHVVTVDVLPVDLQVWSAPGTERSPDELSGALQVSVSGMVAAQLASRGYRVTSQMDWDGTYVAESSRGVPLGEPLPGSRPRMTSESAQWQSRLVRLHAGRQRLIA